MKKKKLNLAPALAALGSSLVFTIPVMAAPAGLSITQEIDQMKTSKEAQSYTVAYEADGETEYKGGTRMKIAFEEGFTPETSVVGDWSDYEGDIDVSVFVADDEEPIFRDDFAENSVVDLSRYNGITSIVYEPVDAVAPTTNISALAVHGDVDTEESKASLKATATYFGALEEEGEFVSIEEKSVEMDCSIYSIEKPTVTLSNATLSHLGATSVTVNNIQGKGNANVSSYKVSVSLPNRLFLDSIDLPTFEHATYRLFVNGNRQDINKDRIYINTKVESLELEIIPDVSDFTQTKAMVIQARDTLNAAADTEVYAEAEVTYGKELTLTETSEKVALHFVRTEPTPTPEPERPPVVTPTPEPEQPPVVTPTPEPEQPPVVTPTPEPTPSNPTVVIVPKPTPTPTPTPEPENVVDNTGVGLQATTITATPTRVSTINVGQTDSSATASLQNALSERVQTTEIVDFSETDDTQTAEVIEETTIEASKEVESPAEEIAKTPNEEATEKAVEAVKKTVNDNRGVQIALILGGIGIVGIGAVLFLLTNKKKRPDPTLDDSKEVPEEEKPEEPTSDEPSKQMDVNVNEENAPPPGE